MVECQLPKLNAVGSNPIARFMKKNKAFTLVELLVVMAIMAALLAILLPALTLSRQIAYKVICLNNLKQLGIATHSYVQSSEVYPVCVSEVNETWSDFIANPAIANDKMLGVPASLWPFHKNEKLYKCPVLSKIGCDISYCYNWQAGRELGAGETAFAGPSDIPPVHPPKVQKTNLYVLTPEKVKSPGLFVLLYDLPLKPEPITEDTAGSDLYKDIDPDDYDSSRIDPNNPGDLWHYKVLDALGPHAKGQSILFADSHTKWYKRWSSSEMTRKPN